MFSPDELIALGLSEQPFAEGPAGRFFYATPALSQRLDLLHHLLQYGDQLLVICAPPGGGKSTLLDQALSGAGEHWRVCQVGESAQIGANALVDRLLVGFGLPLDAEGVAETDGFAKPVRSIDINLDSLSDDEPDSPGGVAPEPEAQVGEGGRTERKVLQLLSFLESLAPTGELAVIAIDDAERLQADAIELIVELTARRERFVSRILLTGGESVFEAVRSHASDPLVRDRLHRIDLSPFNREQTRDYLHTRLLMAGFSGDSPFTEEVVGSIVAASGGNPALINAAASDVLRGQLLKEPAPSASRGPVMDLLFRWWKGLAVGLVGLILLAGVILVFPPTPPAKIPAPAVIIEQPNPSTGVEVTEPVAEAGADPSPAEGAAADPLSPEDSVGTGPSAATGNRRVSMTPVENSAGTSAPLEADAATVADREGVAEAEGSVDPGSNENAARSAASPPAETLAPSPIGLELRMVTPGDRWFLVAAMPRNGAQPAYEAMITNPSLIPSTIPAAPPASPEREGNEDASKRLPPNMVDYRPEADGASPAASTRPPAPRRRSVRWERSFVSKSAARARAKPAAARSGSPAQKKQPPPFRRSRKAAAGTLREIGWLRAQDPARYTIQVMGSSERKGIERFADGAGLSGRAAWLATRRDGRIWYVLVVGVYDDYAAAKAAIEKLRPELREKGPWVRTIGGLLASSR